MSKSDLEATLAYQLRVAGVTGWEREHRFHLKRRWRLDFAFVSDKLAVAVQGGTWSGGRHVRPAGYELDCIKHAEAAILGWRIIPVTSAMVKDGRALALIERALK